MQTKQVGTTKHFNVEELESLDKILEICKYDPGKHKFGKTLAVVIPYDHWLKIQGIVIKLSEGEDENLFG